MDAVVFDIQRFSVDDGPGIRTVVFFKGCNMHCLWCHNPESLHLYAEVMFLAQKCIGCGKCFELCVQNCHTLADGKRVFDRNRCIHCGHCAAVCCTGALTVTGQSMTVEEVFAEIKKDDLFYQNSGGGVTFSGGEPLLQADFLRDVLVECKKAGIHCAIETAGNVPWTSFEKVLPFTDLFLYDIKVVDLALHKKVTGSDNKRIIDNLKKLAKTGVEIWARTPLIPGVNDMPSEKEQLADLLASLETVQKHIFLPYHKLGEGKYESLGLPKPVFTG